MDIHRKIEREKALIQAAQLMRQQTNNEAVRSKLDTQMRDGRRNLEFFEERLRELQMRRMGQGMENMSLGPQGTPGTRPKSGSSAYGDLSSPPAPPPKDQSSSQYGDRSSYGGPTQHGQGPELMPDRHPFPGQPPNSSIPKSRPNFSKLGMFNVLLMFQYGSHVPSSTQLTMHCSRSH
jgi:hypothetical protein